MSVDDDETNEQAAHVTLCSGLQPVDCMKIAGKVSEPVDLLIPAGPGQGPPAAACLPGHTTTTTDLCRRILGKTAAGFFLMYSGPRHRLQCH